MPDEPAHKLIERRDIGGRLVARYYLDGAGCLHARQCEWNGFGRMVRTREWQHGLREGDTTLYSAAGQKVLVALYKQGRMQRVTGYCPTTQEIIFSVLVKAWHADGRPILPWTPRGFFDVAD